MRLYKSDGRLLGRVTVQAAPDTDYLGFNYASLQSPIALEPSSEFILVSHEGGGDSFANDATMIAPQTDDLFIVNAVSSMNGTSFQSGQPSHSYGPLNFQCVDDRIVIK